MIRLGPLTQMAALTIKGVDDAKKALSDWIKTRPERNEENTKKFEAFQKAIKAAQDELSKF